MTVLAASLVGGVAAAPPAQASSITVETLVDLEEGDQVCSLREAIKAANTDAPVDHCPAGSGADTITFGVAGTIFLSGPLPWPTSEIVIDGGGDIVIDGESIFQILYVPAEGDLELRGLVLEHGYASPYGGGAVVSVGALSLVDCTVQDNRAVGLGGGIASAGRSLSLTRTTVRRNSVLTGPGGGLVADAPAQGGTISITDSTFSDNVAHADGGGIYLWARVAGEVVLDGLTVTGNSAERGGGMLAAAAVTDSRITLTDSTFDANVASADGGGAYLMPYPEASILVEGSTFSHNTSLGAGGGAFVSDYPGTMRVANSTFARNSAAGAGAGLVAGRRTAVLNTTVTGNSGSAGLSGGALTNSIVLGNSPSDGLPTSQSSSIVGGVDPGTVLDPAGLADNGGPTKTVALVLTGSNPARGSGDPATCAAAPVSGVDQRGVARVSCDRGAFQSPPPSLASSTTLAVTQVRPVYGQAVGLTAVVTAAAPGGSVPSGTVDFRSGATLLGSAALDGTGRAMLVTTGLPLGPQDLRAGYRGDGDYLPSTSAPVAVRVGPAATITVASGPGVASRFPAPVTFVARVSVAAPGGGVPVGRVQFRAGALILGSAPVDGAGVAALTVQRLPAGRYSIMAYYLGSDAYGPSNSAAVAHTVVG